MLMWLEQAGLVRFRPKYLLASRVAAVVNQRLAERLILLTVELAGLAAWREELLEQEAPLQVETRTEPAAAVR